jgi:hypothetical protein
LIEAHEKAVGELLVEIEAHAAARVRQSGANDDRATGNLVLAVYYHDTSRELDPQLHTHAVAANLTFDGTEGRWKALQASGIYERRAYLTEVYRNSLARELRMLGYEIRDRRDAKGHDRGFEIGGISDELLAKYSQRSRQRDDAIADFVERNGKEPSDNEIAVLIRETRADKLTTISTAEVRKRQRERLSEEECRALAKARAEVRPDFIPAATANRALQHAEEHVFERVSVARDYDILTEALRYGRGQTTCSELKGRLVTAEASGAVLRRGHEITTAAALQREREMVQAVNRGVGACQRLGETADFIPSDRLRPEQRRVIEFVLKTQDRIVNVQGAAGTGKTATLQELKRAIQEAGRECFAIAPTMSAVEELQRVGFSGAITVERLLQDSRSRSALKGRVLILDEAGMVSSRQMSELLRLMEQEDARGVFCGDTQQIQSIEAGDALRILEKESHMKSIALTEVQRQKPRAYRDAIQALRRDPEGGFEMLDAIGAVEEIQPPDRAAHIAKAYAQSTESNVLVVCATHEEIGRVTDAIRAVRKQKGCLGDAVPVARDVSLNWTTAQKTDWRNFQPGQFLGFHRPVQGIAKNETVEVVQVHDRSLVVRNVHGKTRTISRKQAKSFEVFERRTIEVAPGDKLLLTANRREAAFRATNGEIVMVTEVDEKRRIRLEDGRVIPPTFKHFAHGYAVTAHRSQGKSVDSVIISSDGMRKELFYVAASRGKERVLVVTGDKQRLRESVATSSARRSASELVRKTGNRLYQGMRRGLLLARKLAAIATQQESIFDRRENLRNNRKVGRTHEQGISR